MEHFVVGLPIELKNEKIYQRQKIEFNCCIVINKKTYETFKVIVDEVVRKLAMTFIYLELENNTIHRRVNKEILSILEQVYNDLNSMERDCLLTTNISYLTYFKVTDTPGKGKRLNDIVLKPYDVVLLLVDKDFVRQFLTTYDESCGKIIAQLDGANYIKKIGLASSLKPEVVLTFLKNLIHLNLAILVDIFQFSNIYVLTDGIHKLLSDDELFNRFVLASVKKEISIVPPGFEADLRKIVLSFDKKTIFADILAQYNDTFKVIQPLQMLRFLQAHGIVRRAHEYPIKMVGDDILFQNAREKFSKVGSLKELIDKGACLDEMCVELEVSKGFLTENLQNVVKFIMI